MDSSSPLRRATFMRRPLRIAHTLALSAVACGGSGSASDETTDGSTSTSAASTGPGPASTSEAADTTAAVTSTGGDVGAPGEGVSLHRTTNGVVHVYAQDYHGAGYGVGHAYAEDNRCLLAFRIAEVNGRLAAQLGADAPVTNAVHDITVSALRSDRFYRGWFDRDAIAASFAAGAPQIVALAEGYAAGVNRYLADHPDLAPCTVDFTGDVAATDIQMMWVAAATVGSGEAMISTLAEEAPAAASPPIPPAAVHPPPRAHAGSNAWALGRDATDDSRSVHVYNPHFPWAGPQRLYMLHVVIADELDVMGAALGGFALPVVGFSRDVAWGLTFSNAARFTLAELPLTDDPLTYTVDGDERTITAEMLEIDVAGEPDPRQVPFFRSPDGPILDAPLFGLAWSPTTAFAAHDVNADNTRMVEQLWRVAKATDVAGIQATLGELQGVPWSYTVASDASGDVFFGDVSAVPAVTNELLDACVTTPTGQALLAYGYIVLDAARSECAWSGMLAPADLPQLVRSDYVANSNNSYELANVDAPLSGFSGVLGASGAGLDLRPSLGLRMIDDRLAGADGLGTPGFTVDLAREVFLGRRNLGAELLVDGIVADCTAIPFGTADGQQVDLTEVCEALAAWDRRNAVDSTGAAVFRALWLTLPDPLAMFETPAALADPLGTPTGYSEDADVRTDVRDALAVVAQAFADAGLDPAVAWGDVNRVLGPDGAVAMPGGFASEGIFDATIANTGYTSLAGWIDGVDGVAPEAMYGVSYVHVVGLGPDGPTATGLLPYSQATEPDSPYHLDQLQRWADDDWLTFPFTLEQIEADPEHTVLEL